MGKAASKRGDPFLGVSDQFELGRVVGKGSFGKVFSITRKDTNNQYALKVFSKKELIEKNMVKRVIEEKNLLMDMEFPFIVNLRFAFQTKRELCMIVDIITGGDLRYHLERQKRFPIECVRFFATQIVLAISYLHSLNIVHRDIKPDNILLDADGYCHLTDFNVSTKFVKDLPIRGVAGTLSYMAPELLNRESYYESVDWWSTGIVLYELFKGKTPFFGTKAQKEEQILRSEINYIDFADDDFLSLLKGLTCPAALRLKPDQIKSHPFFKDINWDDILEKKRQSPFIPIRGRIHSDVRMEPEIRDSAREEELSEEEQRQFEDWEHCPDVEAYLFKKQDDPLSIPRSPSKNSLFMAHSNPTLNTITSKKRSTTLSSLGISSNLLGKISLPSILSRKKEGKKTGVPLTTPMDRINAGSLTERGRHLAHQGRQTDQTYSQQKVWTPRPVPSPYMYAKEQDDNAEEEIVNWNLPKISLQTQDEEVEEADFEVENVVNSSRCRHSS